MTQPSWLGYELNDRYKIEELLGSGGMSAVYRANDPNLRRIVAVKLIHTHLSKDPDFIRRFEDEAASVAQLRHPNIIQMFDFDHDGETYYMIMEYVPGESLQQRLKRFNDEERKLTLEETVHLAGGVCDAVDFAHKRGLIHRDIKPANVMLNLQGDAILMDFGIVKIIGGTQHTATGAVVGTALYMSPEQIRGERPDHRADIYSLGVMLYEMAGGRPPFAADSAMTVMMMHLNDPVPDVSQYNPTIPPALRGVISKALAKDPAQRYQTAGEMASDLRGILTGTTAPPMADGTMIETPAADSAGATVIEAESPVQDPGGTVVEGTFIEQPAVSQAASAAPAAGVAAPPRQTAPPAQAPQAKRRLSTGMIIGAVAVVVIGLICLIGGGYAVIQGLGGNGGGGETASQTAAPGETPVVVVGDAATATDAAEPTDAPTATTVPTDVPTDLPTETPTVAPTSTPDGAYVMIDSITLNGSAYAVNYSVYNVPPDSGNLHVHIFFDTVPPDQAGSPGSGPWQLSYGSFGDSPFTGYGPGNRGNANQLCVLIANPNHTVNQGTGNCVDLPE
jgi:serine/threonine-protein kinase